VGTVTRAAGEAKKVKRVVLLGPQAPGSNHAGRVLKELGIKQPVVLVTAGWQERESEDEALIKSLGVPVVNLRLHTRSEELFSEGRRSTAVGDVELTAAYKARQERLRHVQVFYRMRLESADDVSRAIAVRHVDTSLIDEEWRISVDQFRQLDSDHLARCREVHAAFDTQWELGQRASVARHREELRALIQPAAALVIAGGHVGSLLNRLRIFDVIGMAHHLPIIAWSAGAMVLTDRVVCFHDYPPYGKDIAQVLDSGLGLAPGLVLLPDPARRVRLDDHDGIGRFARRMAPATCLAMDHGAQVVIQRGRVTSGRAYHLSETGAVNREWKAPIKGEEVAS